MNATRLEIESYIRDTYGLSIRSQDNIFKACFFGHNWKEETIGPYDIRQCLKCSKIEYKNIDYIGGYEEWIQSNKYFFQLAQTYVTKKAHENIRLREKFIDYIVSEIDTPQHKLIDDPVQYRVWLGHELMRITSSCSDDWIQTVFGG